MGILRGSSRGYHGQVATVHDFALMAVSLVFLFLLAVGGLWEIPDAVACADNAELVMEAVPGPGAKIGSVEGRDFLNCTLYWFR